MAFWGVELKPGKPFTLTPANERGRLHISQATIGTGTATKKSVVQCNVGNRSPVFLCSLFPEKTEVCQLHLEFDEAEEVVFSVIGPRSVHLTGYYLVGGRGYNVDNDSESYGEDIADTESEMSADSGDDKYEDSFIDDSDPEVIPPSPISSAGVEEETSHRKKHGNKVNHRRLRKKYQLSESDDDQFSRQQTFANGDSVNEDVYPISSLYKNKHIDGARLEAGETTETETGETRQGQMEDDRCVTITGRKVETVVDGQSKRPSANGASDGAVKLKKKKKEQSKLGNIVEAGEDEFFFGTALKWDKAQKSEKEILGQDLSVINKEDQKTINNVESVPNLSLPSIQEVSKHVTKPKKKKKEGKKDGKHLDANSPLHVKDVQEDKAVEEEAKVDSRTQHMLEKNEENQKLANDETVNLARDCKLDYVQLSAGNGEKRKRKRKERAEEKTLETSGCNYSDVANESITKQDELKSKGMDHDLLVQHEQSQNQASYKNLNYITEQSANDNHSDKKKKKNKTNRNAKNGEAFDVELLTSIDRKDRSDMVMQENTADDKMILLDEPVVEKLEVEKPDGKPDACARKVRKKKL